MKHVYIAIDDVIFVLIEKLFIKHFIFNEFFATAANECLARTPWTRKYTGKVNKIINPDSLYCLPVICSVIHIKYTDNLYEYLMLSSPAR